MDPYLESFVDPNPMLVIYSLKRHIPNFWAVLVCSTFPSVKIISIAFSALVLHLVSELWGNNYVPNSFSICPLLALFKTPCAPCLSVTKISKESTTSTRGVDESLRYLLTASMELTITTKSLDLAL